MKKEEIAQVCFLVVYITVVVISVVYGYEFLAGLLLLLMLLGMGVASVLVKKERFSSNFGIVLNNVTIVLAIAISCAVIPHFFGVDYGMSAVVSARVGENDVLGYFLCERLYAGLLLGADGGFPTIEEWNARRSFIKHCGMTKACTNLLVQRIEANNVPVSLDPDTRVYDMCYYFVGVRRVTDSGLLLAHGVCGSLALILGALLIFHWRNKPIVVPGSLAHRVMGIIYVVSGFIASLLGLLTMISRGAGTFDIAIISMYCVLHWSTLAGAVLSWFVCEDKPAKLAWHRRFFMFNYSVIFGSVFLRVWYLLLIGGLSDMSMFAVLYSCAIFAPIPTALLASFLYFRFDTQLPSNKVAASVP